MRHLFIPLTVRIEDSFSAFDMNNDDERSEAYWFYTKTLSDSPSKAHNTLKCLPSRKWRLMQATKTIFLLLLFLRYKNFRLVRTMFTRNALGLSWRAISSANSNQLSGLTEAKLAGHFTLNCFARLFDYKRIPRWGLKLRDNERCLKLQIGLGSAPNDTAITMSCDIHLINHLGDKCLQALSL